MKQPRKLTRSEKEIVSRNGLIVNEWMYVSESDSYLRIQNKATGVLRNIDKYRRNK